MTPSSDAQPSAETEERPECICPPDYTDARCPNCNEPRAEAMTQPKTVVRRWTVGDEAPPRLQVTSVWGDEQVNITLIPGDSRLYVEMVDALIKLGHPLGTRVAVNLTPEGVTALRDALIEWLTVHSQEEEGMTTERRWLG